MRVQRTMLPDEQIVMSSTDDSLVLTNRRVYYDSVSIGRSSLISVTLDAVASCGLVTRSYPILLILAAVDFLIFLSVDTASFFAANRSFMLVFGIALIIAYIATRKAVISIASNGGDKIIVLANSIGRKQVIRFIDAIELQKHRYMERLR